MNYKNLSKILDQADSKVGLIIGSDTIYGIKNKEFDGTVEINTKRVGSYAFWHSKVKEVIFKERVEDIGFHAFDSCENLESVTFMGDVTQIQEKAFALCKNLRVVKGLNTKATVVKEDAFKGCPVESEIVGLETNKKRKRNKKRATVSDDEIRDYAYSLQGDELGVLMGYASKDLDYIRKAVEAGEEIEDYKEEIIEALSEKELRKWYSEQVES